MYIMIDNYDSFVYNLTSCFKQLNQNIIIYKNDNIDFNSLYKLHMDKKLKGIIISPGPMTPEKSGNSLKILELFTGKIPILGVCLGHQIIGHYFGADVIKGTTPVHGKLFPLLHNKTCLFNELPDTFWVTRYHSLIIDPLTLPSQLQVDARCEDGTIMAISHTFFPIYGVQFHPEAVLTEFGLELLANFCSICEDFQKENI